MRSARTGGAALLLIVTVLCKGCTDTEDPKSPSGATFSGVGRIASSPNIDGTWQSTSTVTGSTCAEPISAIAGKQFVDLAQSDTSLALSVFSTCGTEVASGTGTVSHQGGVSLFYEQQIVLTDICTLEIRTAQSGLVQRGLQNIGGSSRLTVTGIGECGEGLPCEVEAGLLMERCPPAACAIQSCPQ